ncbi:MAG: hypothetical protein WKG07_29140 [Hymenobacter sp.]
MLIEVRDDGRGIDTEAVRRKAVERGLTTAHVAATLDDRAVWAFLFEPGFSMAQESDRHLRPRRGHLDVVKLALDSLEWPAAGGLAVGQRHHLHWSCQLHCRERGLLIEVDERPYAIPLMHTDTVLALHPRPDFNSRRSARNPLPGADGAVGAATPIAARRRR